MIEAIQYLRGFAALAVVLYHAIPMATAYGFTSGIISHLAGFGAFGVDIFFVISGFIMMYIQDKKPVNTFVFMKARIIRIVPLYWLLTLAIFSIYLVMPQIFNSMTADMPALFNSMFFISQATHMQAPLLYVGWTLEWEMLFYFIFSMTYLLDNKRVGLAVAIGTLGAIAYFFQQLIIIEFLLGISAAWLYRRSIINPQFGWPLFLLGCVLLTAGLINKEIVTSYHRLYIWGIPAFLIVLGTLNIKTQKHKILNLLGNASYSIYLVQVFSLPLTYKVAQSIRISTPADIIIISSLAITALVGIAMHRYLEQPLTQWLKVRYNT